SVVALMLLGPGAMYLVVVIRIVTGSLLVGSFLGPSFLLALAGGLTSATAMAVVFRFARNAFSTVGLSLIGSTIHVATQLAVVMLLYVQNNSLIILLPLLLFSSLIGGTIVGWISLRVMAVLRTVRTG
ncbi:MAG: Gx transporter family protein, partial [Bacteroidota bacterium]